MKQLTDISEYNEIIKKYRKKGVLSNDYIQSDAPDLIIHGALYADCHEKNAFLFVKRDAGMRMYYYINDIEEHDDFSKYSDVVVEILFRGELPMEEVEYLSKCGFKLNLIRDQYAGTYGELSKNFAIIPNVCVETAKTLEGVKQACELFNDSFDRLSGDFIPETDYCGLLHSGSILIAWDAKKHFLGALHQVKEKAVNIIGHMAVMSHARGRGVGKALLDAFIEKNKNLENPDKTRYQLWVQRQNAAAVNMYSKEGFKPLNKSTLSLTL